MAESTILREDAQPAFSAPIDRLPEEMFLRVIEISLEADSETRLRDLAGLTLVCRRWKIMVEGSSSLWSQISASDGLAAVRKALSLAQGAPLDLSYDAQTTNIDPKIFFEEIGPHIAQWKSLTAHFKDRPDHFAPDFTFAELETTVAPKLERQVAADDHFVQRSPAAMNSQRPLGGRDSDLLRTAPPLQLDILGVGWNRLAVLQALRESPGLEYLSLTLLKDTTLFPADDNQLISLLSLAYLRLHRNPNPFTRSILSSVTAPSLRFLHVDCTALGDLVTDLLTPAMSHMIPALQSIASKAENIRVDLHWDRHYQIDVGRLRIGLEHPSTLYIHSRAVLDWLRERMGPDFSDLPITLCLYDCMPTPSYLQHFSSAVKVTTLSLQGDPYGPLWIMIRFLSEPHMSIQDGWLLPELETLDTNLTLEAGNLVIVEMLRARHGLVEAGNRATTLPKHLREIRLKCRGTTNDPNPIPDPKFMQDLQKAADGADVYWCGQKWTGSEAEA
ncbi:hypothetical protein FRC04_002727 [Tulasnella sp. 424]|nr:hypothetical protein FRC04_002727 [Tulasnella sp. 424]